ncbi:hypothetical protein L6452_13574 [Arctium lappa]|uniref:Uncharacterized protein n=1 Tax=Arctium lappa TaxID=4217 RepID=A0ACB9CIP8_ARCLA|nr:hypothetical protein L6452_13574 [Arctium lappa]
MRKSVGHGALLIEKEHCQVRLEAEELTADEDDDGGGGKKKLHSRLRKWMICHHLLSFVFISCMQDFKSTEVGDLHQ